MARKCLQAIMRQVEGCYATHGFRMLQAVQLAAVGLRSVVPGIRPGLLERQHDGHLVGGLFLTLYALEKLMHAMDMSQL